MSIKKSIYPKIELRETSTSLAILTTLRKKHNGKWYLWEFFKKWEFIEGEGNTIRYIELFHQEVYFTIILGKVDKKAVRPGGEPIFRLDEIQISEEERLKKLLIF